jgi:pyridoxamine 5'-phosphate oxidase
VLADPFEQFKGWYARANELEKFCEPNTMAISTVSAGMLPSVRYVLLKGVDTSGFIFYTHYESMKGQELSKNPSIAALFYWPLTNRQVRIEGIAQKMTDAENDEYFHSRPVGSQISAWASPQSQVIPDKGVLYDKMKTMEKQVEAEGLEVPRPNWGGFRIIPKNFEFWQGHQQGQDDQGWQYHNRYQYSMTPTGDWTIQMVSP